MLSQYAQSLKGMEAYCFQAYADALEVIPTTLAENAGLNPIAIVTELRNRHAMGERNAGINVRRVSVCLHIVQKLTPSSHHHHNRLFSTGFDLGYLAGGCRPASVGVDECYRALHGDGDSAVEDR